MQTKLDATIGSSPHLALFPSFALVTVPVERTEQGKYIRPARGQDQAGVRPATGLPSLFQARTRDSKQPCKSRLRLLHNAVPRPQACPGAGLPPLGRQPPVLIGWPGKRGGDQTVPSQAHESAWHDLVGDCTLDSPNCHNCHAAARQNSNLMMTVWRCPRAGS